MPPDHHRRRLLDGRRPRQARRDRAPWPRRYDAMVFVDDSHATGFIGKHRPRHPRALRRAGPDRHHHHDARARRWAAPRAAASAAAAELVELCRQRARPYLFSNTVAPVIVARRDQGARPDLRARPSGATSSRGTRRTGARRLTEAGFDIKAGDSPIVPVMLYNAKLAQDMARDLFAEGIYVVGFFFPVVPKGQARIRTQLSAAHERGAPGARRRGLRQGGAQARHPRQGQEGDRRALRGVTIRGPGESCATPCRALTCRWAFERRSRRPDSGS